MFNMLLVGLGGAIGAMLRYATALAFTAAGSRGFPWATLTINLSGCLAIGLVMGYLIGQPPSREPWRLFIVVGILGGFTTFSAFGYEALELLREDRLIACVSYVTASNLFGIVAAALGYGLMTQRA